MGPAIVVVIFILYIAILIYSKYDECEYKAYKENIHSDIKKSIGLIKQTGGRPGGTIGESYKRNHD